MLQLLLRQSLFTKHIHTCCVVTMLQYLQNQTFILGKYCIVELPTVKQTNQLQVIHQKEYINLFNVDVTCVCIDKEDTSKQPLHAWLKNYILQLQPSVKLHTDTNLITHRKNEGVLNLFKGYTIIPDCIEENNQGNHNVFEEVCTHILGNKNHTKQLLDYLAAKLQHPERRIHYQIVIYTEHHILLTKILDRILSAVLGEHHVSDIPSAWLTTPINISALKSTYPLSVIHHIWNKVPDYSESIIKFINIPELMVGDNDATLVNLANVLIISPISHKVDNSLFNGLVIDASTIGSEGDINLYGFDDDFWVMSCIKHLFDRDVSKFNFDYVHIENVSKAFNDMNVEVWWNKCIATKKLGLETITSQTLVKQHVYNAFVRDGGNCGVLSFWKQMKHFFPRINTEMRKRNGPGVRVCLMFDPELPEEKKDSLYIPSYNKYDTLIPARTLPPITTRKTESQFASELLNSRCRFRYISQNKALPFENPSSNKRPDFTYLMIDRVVIVEFDEDAHRSYYPEQEINRLVELRSVCSAKQRPLTVIRVNSNKYNISMVIRLLEECCTGNKPHSCIVHYVGYPLVRYTQVSEIGTKYGFLRRYYE